LKTDDILALYDLEQRINIEYPGVRKEHRPHVIRFVNQKGGPHFILYSRLAGADVESVITEEQAYFGQLGEVEWKVYAHDQPADLRQRLLASGFEPEEPEAVMVLDLEETSEIITSTPDSITVRRLEPASQLEVVRQIEETVWGEDMAWINEQLGADMEKADYLSVYAAYVDGQAACAGWIYFHANGQFADLWGGSTLPEHAGGGRSRLPFPNDRCKPNEPADRGQARVSSADHSLGVQLGERALEALKHKSLGKLQPSS